MKKYLFAGLMLVLSVSVQAQELVLPELAGFKKITSYPVYTPENLWDHINGAADGYLAYKFENLHVAEYKKGKDVIKLEVYRHSDHINAFGIYSSERSPSFDFLKLGAQGYNTGGSTNFFKGKYYVKIRTYSKKEKTLQAARSLAGQVDNMLEGETTMPAALGLFPPDSRKANEETYIGESVLGHNYLNNAFKAAYKVGSDEFSVFILEKQSPAEVIRVVNTWLAELEMDPAEEDNGKMLINDGYNGNIFLGWKGNRIVAISGLAKDQTDLADKYTSAILK